MSLRKESDGDIVVCDGCGRSEDAAAGNLAISPYLIKDPNLGSTVQHHYCAHCASNRGLHALPVQTVANWSASPPVPSDAAHTASDAETPPAQ